MLLSKRIYKTTGEEDFIAELERADKKMLDLEGKMELAKLKYGPDSAEYTKLYLQVLQARSEYDKYLNDEYWRAGQVVYDLQQQLARVHFKDENATKVIDNISLKLSQAGAVYEEIGAAKRISDQINEYYQMANTRPAADLRPVHTYGVVPVPAPATAVTDHQDYAVNTIAAVQTFGVTPVPNEAVEAPLPKAPGDLDYAYAYGEPIVAKIGKEYLKERVKLLIEERGWKVSEVAFEAIMNTILEGGSEIIAGGGTELVLSAVAAGLMEAIPVVGGVVIVASVIHDISENLEKLHKRELLAKYGTTNVSRNGTLVGMTQPKSRVPGSHWTRDKETVGEPLKVLLENSGWEEVPPPAGYSWDTYTKTLVPEWKIVPDVDFEAILKGPQTIFSNGYKPPVSQPPSTTVPQSWQNPFVLKPKDTDTDNTGYSTNPIYSAPSQDNSAQYSGRYTPASFDMANHSIPLAQLDLAAPKSSGGWLDDAPWLKKNKPASKPAVKKIAHPQTHAAKTVPQASAPVTNVNDIPGLNFANGFNTAQPSTSSSSGGYTPASFNTPNHSLQPGQFNMSAPAGGSGATLPGLGAPAPKHHHAKKHTHHHSSSTHDLLPKHTIAGKKHATYNITVKEVVGHKISTQHVNGTHADNKMAGEQIAKILKSVVSASQLHTHD